MVVSTVDTATFFKQQAQEARDFLEGTMSDVTQEQATWHPDGRATSIAAHYAHVITSQDMGLHDMLKGTAPLIASSWAGKAGLSEPPPFGPGSDLHGWANRVTVNLPALREYAQAVYNATDEHFGTLSTGDMGRSLDLSAVGLGEQPSTFVLLAGWVSNVLMHTGEISCLKGLQGAKGYPF